MGYAQPGTSPLELIELAQEAERLGYDSAWAAEAWGTDAVSVLAWLAATTTRIKIGSAILQIPARTPANTAMTAATLDLLSGGRFLLGLGTSGPQVVEGWHGEPWGKPLAKTREYVEIVRAVLRRDVLEHHGEHYDIPYSRRRRDRPRQAAEADGAAAARRDPDLPRRRCGRSPSRWRRDRGRLAADLLRARAGARDVPGRRSRARGSSIAPACRRADPTTSRPARDALKPYYALYIGGMGSRGKNFYNDLLRALRLRGGGEADPGALPRRQEARGRGRRAGRLRRRGGARRAEGADRGAARRRGRESGATTMLVSTRDVGTLRAVAELAL